MTWLAALVGVVVGLAGTRAVRSLAPRVGLVDAPDGVRKLQSRAIPLGGGLAIFLATVLGTLAAIAFDPQAAEEFAANARAWWAFLASATLLVVVGLLDDWYELVARYKLAGQFLAAIVFVYGGDLTIRFVSCFGLSYELGLMSGPVTIFWMILAINSLNLLDGMDGLLGTVGGVTCLALAGVAYLTGQHLPAAAALAVAGGLLGFLRFNLPPASVYLGDCGSMLIGLIVGALCIKASLKSHAVATLVPICVLVLPFLDTFAAVIRRKLSGRSMAHADREHLHHVLLRRGWSVRKALVVVAVVVGLAGAGAVASVYFVTELIGLCVSLTIVIALVATGLFGTAELQLMTKKLSGSARAVSRRGRPAGDSSSVAPSGLPARTASALPPAQSP
jgi:UDP-GlcNAc:undecaprenyl-phosphate GlcNAc-1-phosphate transferase